jgi:hypothetical protein
VLVDGRGVPLSLIVTGANRHDVSQLAQVLDAVALAKPGHVESYLYADKGYDGEPAQEEIAHVALCQGYIVKSEGVDAPGRIADGWLKRLTHGSTGSESF